MSDARPVRRSSDASSDFVQGDQWQQVVRLGQQLIALQQRYSIQSTRLAVEELVSAQHDLIIETATRLFNGRVSLWMPEWLGFDLGYARGKGDISNQQESYPRSIFSATPAGKLMQHAAEKMQVCTSEQSATSTSITGAWAIALPLLMDTPETSDRPLLVGVLQVERPDGSPMSPVEIVLIDGMGIQIALALQTMRQQAIENWRIEQLNLVQQVSAQIAGMRNLDDLVQRVTQLIIETFDYYYVAIFTLEPGQALLQFRGSAGPQRVKHPVPIPEAYSPTLVVYMGEGIIGQAAVNGQEILACNVDDDPRYHHADALPETRSEIALPLKIEGHVLGVLDVQSDLPDDFTDSDLIVLRALADNIAVAVKGAGLYSALSKRIEHLAALYEVSNAITSILDEKQLLEEVVELIQKRFGYPFVHLFSVHPGRRKIFYESGSGVRSQKLKDDQLTYDLDDPRGLIPWVARNMQTVLANDVDQEPRYRPSPLQPEDTRAELTVPLVYAEQVLGVLDVQSDQLGAFTKEDIFLFEALADHVAIAMRNAQLYRSERWRRQVADGLREVAGLLSADVSLDQVLEAILIELENTLPCDLATIWLLDKEILDVIETESLPPLRLAAVRGLVAPVIELEIGLTLEDVLRINGVVDAESGQDWNDSWLQQALTSPEPTIRSPDMPCDPFAIALEFSSDYSAIAAPLRTGDRTLGVLTLAHHTPLRYGSEAWAMTTTFASYAAVAIENTRLFEAAHEQAWISTALLQVADATQRLTDMGELLSTVVQISLSITGIKSCMLYLLEDGDVFVPAAASGLTPAQQAEFERWRFAAEDVPSLDCMLQKPQPSILVDQEKDWRLASITYAGLDVETLFDDELLVLVPLQAQSGVLGAFLIAYRIDQQERYNLQKLDNLFDEKLVIIQGIAYQTATALENIRLLKAQKQEAYVSVALLQVAQTVNSMSGLDEVLAAIARITPILAGVKRVAIYLYDAEMAVYYLAQGYGLPGDAEGQLYAVGEFPFLDAVCGRDRLVAASRMGFTDADFDDVDSWTQLPVPEMSQVDELLLEDDALLLGFPLTARGDALGMILVEEPDPASVDRSFGALSYRRLREKRLEIMTGISQQSALAIQNDRLQREMVVRERLEQEMQLAREIQRTFLPNRLPDLPGYEMSVTWQTAREVGGDFYDYFELTGDRFGLVIADVADKGMPAALFMTLVRTLVRATVQEADSPAEVLARVNDVLLPDAQQGMFVTLCYATLSLQTGELVYANAGHNPPIWIRYQSGELESLRKGGMALGVLEGSLVEEHCIHLQPGDCLIFFTDGVTDAFAPDNSMYGEQRLHQVIREISHSMQYSTQVRTPWTAQMLAQAIDSSVSEFMQGAPRSDDLTLMVLHRMSGDSEVTSSAEPIDLAR